MSNNETCDFCSKNWIGYVSMPDGSLPWVCDDHWDMYSKQSSLYVSIPKVLGTDN